MKINVGHSNIDVSWVGGLLSITLWPSMFSQSALIYQEMYVRAMQKVCQKFCEIHNPFIIRPPSFIEESN